ncbi:MAG TPA: hypothetical protein VMN56_02535 [Casimicrobiaceae bacterium]|nr:hypothetical protein [Casimicrobiaceae bacterium]
MMPAARAPRFEPARADEAPSRSIPFDYVFAFALTGEADRTQRQTVTVGVDASFTAVSIGYGVVPEVTTVRFGLPPAPASPILLVRPQSLRSIAFGDLIPTLQAAIGAAPDAPKDMPALEAALRNGIRLNPKFARVALAGDGNGTLDPSVLENLFEVCGPPVRDVQFLYALFDEGSGREFQSEPILNIAGLGSADGRRPFRYFAQPITFAPLSSIRLDITEKSTFRGALHVSLHGYKILGAASANVAQERRRPRRGTR